MDAGDAANLGEVILGEVEFEAVAIAEADRAKPGLGLAQKMGDPAHRVEPAETKQPDPEHRGVDEGCEPQLAAQLGMGGQWDCQEFRVRTGIMGEKESPYVPTQRACDSG